MVDKILPVAILVLELGHLEQGWDSYGAKPIRADAQKRAIWLLATLLKQSVPNPAVVPMPTGGVALEWHSGSIDLEVEVEDETKVTFIWTDEVSGEELEGELPSDEQQLVELVLALPSS